MHWNIRNEIEKYALEYKKFYYVKEKIFYHKNQAHNK